MQEVSHEGRGQEREGWCVGFRWAGCWWGYYEGFADSLVALVQKRVSNL
jgi:hypothetical protein